MLLSVLLALFHMIHLFHSHSVIPPKDSNEDNSTSIFPYGETFLFQRLESSKVSLIHFLLCFHSSCLFCSLSMHFHFLVSSERVGGNLRMIQLTISQLSITFSLTVPLYFFLSRIFCFYSSFLFNFFLIFQLYSVILGRYIIYCL